MERSYKVLCSDYIAKVQESEIVVNIEKFSSVAGVVITHADSFRIINRTLKT